VLLDLDGVAAPAGEIELAQRNRVNKKIGGEPKVTRTLMANLQGPSFVELAAEYHNLEGPPIYFAGLPLPEDSSSASLLMMAFTYLTIPSL